MALCGSNPHGILHTHTQVLANRYAGPGTGISFHNDGPLFQPRVTILTLGDPALIHFVGPMGHTDVTTVLLRPRSLFVFEEECYSLYQHGIPPSYESETVGVSCINLDRCLGAVVGDVVPRGMRWSLTIRRVTHVAKSHDCVFSQQDTEEMARRWAWWRDSISEK